MHARWLNTIESFQFDIVHKPGTEMGPSDALSRRPDWADERTGGATTKGRTIKLNGSPSDIPPTLTVGQRCAFSALPPVPPDEWILDDTAVDLAAGDSPSYVGAATCALRSVDFVCALTRSALRRGGARAAADTGPADHADSGKGAAGDSPSPTAKPSTRPSHRPPGSQVDRLFDELTDALTAPRDDQGEEALMLSVDRIFDATRATLEEISTTIRGACSEVPPKDRTHLKLTEVDGMLFHDVEGRRMVFVPDKANLRSSIVAFHHKLSTAGHLGAKKSTEALARAFWWPGSARDMDNYVRACPTCQRNKRRTQLPFGSPAPFPPPHQRWLHVTMDGCSGLPTSPRGNNKFWVFVDKLTKRVVAVPLPDNLSTTQLASAFLTHVFQHHGLPAALVSDRDPLLTAELWQTLCRILNIRLNMSTANSPQTDGQSESAVGTLVQMLRALVNYNGSDWDLFLPVVVHAYNDSVHPATGFTPFFLDHGDHPPSPASLLAQGLGARPATSARSVSAAEFASRIRDNLLRTRIRLGLEQQRIAARMAKTMQAREFAPGDRVMLNYKAAGVVGERLGKLRPQWLGPFEVLEKRYASAYRLKLPPNMAIHPTVNVRYLKPFLDHEIVPDQPLVQNANITLVTDFRIGTEADGVRRAQFRAASSPPLPELDHWLTAQQVVELRGFDLASRYLTSLRDLRHKGNDYVGSPVLDSFNAGRFKGIVSAFDPLDTKLTYEIVYEDGDSRWLSWDKLKPRLVRPARLPLAKLAALALQPDPKHFRVLVLFSGTDSVGEVLRALLPPGSACVNIDIDPTAPRALCADVMEWDYGALPRGMFGIIWASPPCVEYSVAKSVGVRDLAGADRLVLRTLKIFDHFRPRFWFLENPVGKLATRPFMQRLLEFRYTVSYCRYGTPYRKNTHIWASSPPDPPLLRCSAETPCSTFAVLRRHAVHAQVGAKVDVPGARHTAVLHRLPTPLLWTLLRSPIDMLAAEAGRELRGEGKAGRGELC